MRIWIVLITTAIMISGCEVSDSAKVEGSQAESDNLVADATEEVKVEPIVEAVEKTADEGVSRTEPEEENLLKVETIKVEPTSEPAAEVVEKAVEETVAEVESSADDIVATVNGVEITEGEISEKIDERMKARVSRMGVSGREMSADEMDKMKVRLRQSVVELMVEKRILQQKMESKGIAVNEEEIDARIAEMAEQRGVALGDIEGELAKSGMTMEGLRSQVKMGLGVQKLVDLEMGSEGQVSEAEAKKYYDENPKRFSAPEQVKASHILIKTEGLDEAGKAEARNKIEDLLKQVKEGTDFVELAKTNSDCPSGKRGGDLGFFARERMVKEFSDAAFSMQEGDVSDIVETKFGYHIIKVTGKKEASTTSYDEAKEDIISNLERQKKGEFWRKYRTDLKSEAEIVWSEKEKAVREEAERKREETRKKREEAMKKPREESKTKPGSPPKVTPVPSPDK